MKSLMKQAKSGLITGYFVMYALVCAFVIIAACATATKNATKSQPQQEPQIKEETQQAQEQVQIEEAKKDSVLEKEKEKAYSYGYTHWQPGNYEQALPYLLKTAELDKQLNPDSLSIPVVYRLIGRSYFEIGKLDSAYYYYSEGLKYLPGDLGILRWLQWFYFNQDQIDKYIDTSEDILKFEKDEAQRKQTLEDLKVLYMNRQEYDKALEKLEELLVMEPDNREFESERIGIIRETGGDEALIKEWEEQHQKNPGDAEVIWNLLTTYENQFEYTKVIEFADKYLALNPDDIDAREKKVKALQETGKIDEALDLLKELNKLNPEEPQYLLDIAEMYQIDKKNHQEAARWAYNALGIKPGLGKANLLFANIIIDYINVVKDKYKGKEPERIEIDHKLIYEVTLEYFKDAAKDPNTKANADRMVNFCSLLVRTTGDKHMSKGHDKPKIPEYTWVWRYKK